MRPVDIFPFFQLPRWTSLGVALLAATSSVACVVAPPAEGTEEDYDYDYYGEDYPEDNAEPAPPVLTETPFTDLVSQTFRWEDVEYSVESVTQMNEVGEWILGAYEDNWVVLKLLVTNRVEAENFTDLDWDLVLADGSRIGSDTGGRMRMDPLQTGHITIEFQLDGPVDLHGALLQPSDVNLTYYAPLQVPLDAPMASPYPVPVEALAGKVFESQDPESFDRWRVTITSANVDVDSDYDGGRRAPYGMKYLDVSMKVHLFSTNVNGFFSDGGVYVESGGYAAPEMGDHDLFEYNEARDLQYVFELPEDAQEFLFRVRTGIRSDEDEWEEVHVDLGTGTAG